MTDRRVPWTWISVILWITLVAWAAGIAWNLHQRDEAARQTVQLRTKNELDRVSARIGAILDDARHAANSLAQQLDQVPDDPQTLDTMIEAVAKRHSSLTGLGIAFAPFAYDGNRRLFAPVVERRNGTLTVARLEKDYDYTGDYAWYRDAMKSGVHWSQPTPDERSGERIVVHSVRHVFSDGREAVIFVMLPLQPFKAAVAAMDLGDQGYGFLVSAKGRIMAHPISTLARDLIEVSAAAKSYGSYFTGLTRALSEQGPGVIRSTSPVTGQPSDITLRRIDRTGWLVAAVASRAELPLDRAARHRNLLLLTALGVAILLMLPLLDRLIRGPLLGNWAWSILTSAVLIAGIGFVWHFNLAELSVEAENDSLVSSTADLEDARKQWIVRALLAKQELPRFLPTGVFVQSVEFISSNNVVLTGYVWQRFDADSTVPDGPGFIMPEADTVEITEAYRITRNGQTVAGWYFRVTLRQSFNYSRYPFDWEDVWIRLWPQAFDKNVVLVPDLDAYGIINPSTLPGIEEGLFIGGWTPVSSYFEYKVNNYRANFGVDKTGVIQGRPELYFTLLIRRNFLDPFVSNLTPIILVLLLIFAMLMTVQRKAKNFELLGFSAATIITTCAALFFAVLISHIELRSSLAATRIFYLEYFYFITYGVILLVCVNSILFTRDSQVIGIHYRDNLLPKLFYWPTVLTAMFVVTLLVFL